MSSAGPRCPACGCEAPQGGRFCPACGSLLHLAVSAAAASSPLAVTGTASPNVISSPGRHPSSVTPFDRGRFIPGTTVAGRYRILGLIGRGGMGEVYHADDLKIGQTVALKFLPKQFEKDTARLAQLAGEVRVARQISHPNACRVYDMGEVEGLRFISMEFVDGENLASLLRRIGRLPKDKAVQLARQMCAGLAAAHEQGVLHRDLKPANVMIDGRGRARIMDFGLAGFLSEMAEADPRSGTLAYMAPEQLAGRAPSVRSDLYALGLVLYELFTGQPAFKAATQEEMVRLQQQSAPSHPSVLVEGFDPAVERAILRCLEKDPRERPASALSVAAALPGGDPLAAALAAGETPSPELVADAGDVGAVRPAIGLALLALVVAGFGVVAPLSSTASMLRQIRIANSPEALEVGAREILRKLGHDAAPRDSAHGFSWDWTYIDHLQRDDTSPDRWKKLGSMRPAPIGFWYRQSPRPLVPWDHWLVTANDPPLQVTGAASLWLDPEGNLTDLSVVPPERDDAAGPFPPPDWTALLAMAGLDAARMKPVQPAWTPVHYCDSRSAWEGTFPSQPDVPIRVEAGGYQGKPTYFRIVPPWQKPWRMEEYSPTTGEKVGGYMFLFLSGLIVLAGLLIARRNIRLGRGDRRVAFRLAWVVFAARVISQMIWAHHVPDVQEESKLILEAVVWALYSSSLLWVVYIALEPYARKLWPEVLISWSRLLAGRFRDPRIGQDILIGCLASVAVQLLNWLRLTAPEWLGLTPARPAQSNLAIVAGLRDVAGQLIGNFDSLLPAVFLLFFLLLLRVILRRQWAAIVVFLALGALLGLLNTTTVPVLEALFGLAIFGILLVVMMRFGLLASLVLFLIPDFAWNYPLDFSTWYAGRSLLFLLGVIALAVYGFIISLAGRPLFRGPFLPE